jgi:adenylosuccinate lyase
MNFIMSERYEHPLGSRYASKEMSNIWSNRYKITTWRRLWIALATAQLELGVPGIEHYQIEQMKENIDDIDFEYASEVEKQLRHDVMSHIHAFGKVCPDAKKIIHLGATSCFVTDNTELIQIKGSIEIIVKKLLRLMEVLAKFADQYKDLPTLGFTHYQPAQLTT